MKYLFNFLLVSFLFIYSCSESNSFDDNLLNPPSSGENGGSDNDDYPDSGSWLIEQNLVFDGGPGKDGIPALLNPKLKAAADITYLSDDDLVIGIKNGNKVIAFPHKILDWHEIINMDINDKSIAITYCPLTGTGIGWNRIIDNNKTTFGVSGLLYKNNLIPYDRASDSNWSQLKLECVNGNLIGSKPDNTVLVEIKWGLWKKLYPQSEVVSTETGFSRDYARYPYGSYKSNNQYFIFPIDPLLNTIPSKERVHVIIDDNAAKVYRFKDFESNNIIIDTFNNKNYILIGNKNFIVSFLLDGLTNNLEFTYDFKNTEVILRDNEDNQWNLFGEAISGPRKGDFIQSTKSSMMAYYFSVESFYEAPLIYTK